MDFSDDEDLAQLDLDRIEEEATKTVSQRGSRHNHGGEERNRRSEDHQSRATGAEEKDRDSTAVAAAKDAAQYPRGIGETRNDVAAAATVCCETCRLVRSRYPAECRSDSLFPVGIFGDDFLESFKFSNGARDARVWLLGARFDPSAIFCGARSRLFRLFFQRLPSLLDNPEGVRANPRDPSLGQKRIETLASLLLALDFIRTSLRLAHASPPGSVGDERGGGGEREANSLYSEVRETTKEVGDIDGIDVEWSDDSLQPLVSFANRLLLTIRLRCHGLFHHHRRRLHDDDDDDLGGVSVHGYLLIFWRLVSVVVELTRYYGHLPILSRGNVLPVDGEESSAPAPSFHPVSLRDQYVYLFVSDSVALFSRRDPFLDASSSSSVVLPNGALPNTVSCDLIERSWRSLFQLFSSDDDRPMSPRGGGQTSSSGLLSSLIRSFFATSTREESRDGGCASRGREGINGASDVHSTRRWWYGVRRTPKMTGGAVAASTSTTSRSVTTVVDWKNASAFSLFVLSRMHLVFLGENKTREEKMIVGGEGVSGQSGGGRRCVDSDVSNNKVYDLAKTLLKRALDGEAKGGGRGLGGGSDVSWSVSSKELRLTLTSFARLVASCGPNFDVLGTFWDYFGAELNRDFEREDERGDDDLSSPLTIRSTAKTHNNVLAAYERTPFRSLEKLRNALGDFSRDGKKKGECGERNQPTPSPSTVGGERNQPSTVGSSFHLFLRLVAECRAAQFARDDAPFSHLAARKKWNSFKGKIYTKLHSRRIAELTDVGVANLADMFLALTMVAENEEEERELVKLLCGHVANVKSKDEALIVVKMGSLVMYLIYLHSRQRAIFDVENVAKELPKSAESTVITTLASIVDSCGRHWIGASRSPMPRASAESASPQVPRSKLTSSTQASPPPRRDIWWKVLRYYCQQLTDVHARKLISVDSSRQLLFPGFLEVLLSSPTPHEFLTILRLYGEAFVNFWSSFRTSGNNTEPIPSHVSFANSAWEYLLPVLLRRSTGGCPVDLASRVADLLVDFTRLADSIPPSSQSITYSGVADGSVQQVTVKGAGDLVNFMTGDKRVAIAVLTAYLTRLLNVGSTSDFSLDAASLESSLLSTWFRFQVGGGGGGAAASSTPLSADARSLSHQLFKHNRLVARVCKHLNPDFISLQSFIQAFGSSSDPIARNVLTSLCRDFLQWAQPILKQSNDGDEARVSLVFKAAHLFLLHASSALFDKNDPQCPLISVVNRFLLPRSFLLGESPRLRLPIRDFLPLFLSSLATILAKSPEAKFLANKIGEVVFWHVHKFGNDNGGGGVAGGVASHPLMTTLTMTLADAEKNVRDEAEHIFISQIGSTWVSATNPDLLEKFAPPASPLLPLQFLLHLLKFSKSKSDSSTKKGLFYAQRFVRSSVLLLPHLLDAPFQRLTSDVSLLLEDTVALIASSTKEPDFLRPTDRRDFVVDVVKALKAAIGGAKFAANNHQLMKMFDVVAFCNPNLLVDCIPEFLSGVSRVESRRGIGADAAMRRRISILFQKLGERGKEAIAKLTHG